MEHSRRLPAGACCARLFGLALFLTLCAAHQSDAITIIGGPSTFDGHDYFLLSPDTWPNAEAFSQSLGGHLVAVNNAAENEFVRSTFGDHGELWLGFNDIATEGVFVWTSGDPVTFTRWDVFEPNDAGSNEDAAFMFGNSGTYGPPGFWNDVPTGITVFGVAEVAPVPEPATLFLLGSGLLGLTRLRRRW